MITPSTAGILIAGQTFSLNCSVSGTTNPATYQWFDNNGTQLATVNELQFSLLRASDAGLYTCRVAVGSVMLESSTTVNVNRKYWYSISNKLHSLCLFLHPWQYSTTQAHTQSQVYVQTYMFMVYCNHTPHYFIYIVPPPADVRVTYPIRVIAGSSSNLTCTVEFNPTVDIPVIVTTEWSGPARTMFLPDKVVTTVMVNLTTYTSTVTVDAARNGSYTCQATVNSGGTTSDSANIIVGMSLLPYNYSCVQGITFFPLFQPPSLLRLIWWRLV